MVSACSVGADHAIALDLREPIAVSLSAVPPNAFVDRGGEPWFYFASEGLGDNPERPSSTRLTFTMARTKTSIDNYFAGAMFFRAPGVRECDAFRGMLAEDDSGGRWKVRVDAECVDGGNSYRVSGELSGF